MRSVVVGRRDAVNALKGFPQHFLNANKVLRKGVLRNGKDPGLCLINQNFGIL